MAVAAEKREFEGLRRHARVMSPVALPLDYAAEAEIAGRRWLLAANGPGPVLASAAAEAALDYLDARAVLSTGYCGALDPVLQRAEVFVATEVWGPERRFAALPVRGSRRAASGALVSQDRVATTQEEKAGLFSQGAAAVEMEAVAVARVACERGIPFYCVRVVSDDARTAMPFDLNRYRRPDGRFDRARIARTAAWRPWLWGALLQFDLDCRRATVTLGDYLAACRF